MRYKVFHRRSPVKSDVKQDVDFYAYMTKAYAFSCPPLIDDISGLFKYREDTEIAIVLPIFVSWKAEYSPYTDALSKVAPYLLRDFLTKTDIREHHIPIYICVSEEALPIAQPYINAAGVPSENVIVFQARDYHVANKIECVLNPYFDRFPKVVWCDIMHTIITPDKETLLPFGKVLRAWDTEAQPLLIPRPNFRVKFRHPNDKKFENRKARFPHAAEKEATHYAKAVAHIYINGWINGFGHQLRNTYWRKRMRYLAEITNGQNDEYITEVVASEIGTDRIFCLSDADISISRTVGSWRPSLPRFETRNALTEHYWDG